MLFRVKNFIFLLSIYTIFSYLTFPLKKDDQNLTSIDSPKEFIEKKMDSKFYILVNIGSQKATVKAYLYMSRTELIIAGNGIKYSKYNELNSESYNCSYCKIKEYYDGFFREIIVSNEDFYIENDKNGINIVHKMKFVLGKSSIYLDPPEGVCGLQLPQFNSEIDYNLIISLKKANGTNSYNWYLDFENFANKEAKMVVDGFPHDLNNKKYNSKKFVQTNAISVDSAYLKYPLWALKFSDIFYGDINMNLSQENKTALIQFDFGMIVAPKETQDIMEKEFFNEYYKKNICFNDSLTISNYIYCKNVKDFNVNNFKSIYFKSVDLNIIFELSYEDLFYYTNEYIYFLILFREYKWIIGEIFLKKYHLVFNQDEKTIGYYLGVEKSKNEQDTNDKNNESKFEFSLIHILLILILLTLIIIGIILYTKKGKRKNRANELDDDNYEYSSPINDAEKGNKIIE